MSLRNVVLAVVMIAALAGGGIFLGSDILDTEDRPADDGANGADAVEDVDDSTDTADSHADVTNSENDDSPSDGTDSKETDATAPDTQSDGGDDDTAVETTATETPEPGSDETLADIPVALYSADPAGPLEDGQARLYNTSSEELKATYNFTDGDSHNFTIENLTRTTTYDLVVNVSSYPDETITFNPRISTQVNETVGYEFRGADTYEMDWEVDDADSSVTYRGYSALDADGNYYVMWYGGGPSPINYLYLAANNQSYVNNPTADADWQHTDTHWGDPGNAADIVTIEGLSDLEHREFIEVKEPEGFTYDELHVYDIPASLGGAPQRVHVDSETGYVVSAEIQIEEWEDPTSTRSVAEMYSHGDKNFSAIPDDFPIEQIENA